MLLFYRLIATLQKSTNIETIQNAITVWLAPWQFLYSELFLFFPDNFNLIDDFINQLNAPNEGTWAETLDQYGIYFFNCLKHFYC